jgi:hypothetical protein
MTGRHIRLAVGAAIWVFLVTSQAPSPLAVQWAVALLLLAALVLVPLGLPLVLDGPSRWEARLARWITLVQLPAAAALLGSFTLDAGALAAMLALPWFLTTALVALVGRLRIGRRGFRPLPELCIDAGLIYLAIGGGWTVLSRLGARPLDFEPIIVLLTAIHFHYAGFLLPLLTGLAGRQLGGAGGAGGAASRWAALGVIAGVPLVAAGITATQLGCGPWLECLAVGLTTLASWLVAWLYLTLARNSGQRSSVRALWLLAGGSLVFSMVLAGAYGLRFFMAGEVLDIPWMRALHGTANAFGFALAGLLAWGRADLSFRNL